MIPCVGCIWLCVCRIVWRICERLFFAGELLMFFLAVRVDALAHFIKFSLVGFWQNDCCVVDGSSFKMFSTTSLKLSKHAFAAFILIAN